MRTRLAVLLCAATVLACKGSTRQQREAAAGRSDKFLRVRDALPGRYVVVLKDSVPVAQLADTAADLARRYKGSVLHVYGAALHGFALEIPSVSAPALAEEPVVRYVEEDGRMRIAGMGAPGAALRLASAATPGPTGAGATVYVLDTGVRADHLELAGRASAAWPDPRVTPATGDCNGHGTWVAALAAGSTVGVAPGASIQAVTVLGCDGAGAVSTVLAGLDWLARNHGASAVALLPFSGPPSVSLDEALGEVIASGVPLVAAAGNSSADACDASPGRVPSVLTLGATGASPAGSALALAPLDLTNQGPCVDLFADGDRVTSAWNVDPSATHAMSGTSAAAARAAGAAALFLDARPGSTPANVADGVTGTAKVGLIGGLAQWTPNRLLDPPAIRSGADSAAPTVSLPASLDGSVVSGTVSLRAVAADDVGVTQVAYFVDGVFASASGVPPWLAEWNTTLNGNGAHTIVARAYDAAGRVGVSAPATVTVENVGFAAFDPARSVLVCPVPLATCDTGPLVTGRGSVGPERNAPNTIDGACADGAAGVFHLDESVDGIRIASVDGAPLTVGKGVEVEVKVWAYVDFTRDALDLYASADATQQSWRLLGTLVPADAGAGTLSFRFTLPEGGLQALRAAFRYGGAAATCTQGLYDDRDDLVFAVAPGTPDVTKPTVAVAAPVAGAVLGGATILAATATDDSGVVSRVEFVVDGKVVGTSWLPRKDRPDRFELAWDARTVADGPHAIVARATDGAGNVAESSPVAFRVADVTPPSVAIRYPLVGAAVTGTIVVEADASDDRGVASVSFYAGATLIGNATAPPWRIAWNTALVSGTVALTARAVDAAGNASTSAAATVFVDHVPPKVAIVSPAMLESPAPDPLVYPPPPDVPIPPVVGGSVTIVASVSDEHLLGRVEYWVGGTLIGTDGNPYPGVPSSAVWNAGTFPNGLYDIVAKAYDAAGNMTASAPVTVRVKDEAAPLVTITAPAAGASLRLPADASADVIDDGIVTKVEFLLDGTIFATDRSPPYAATLGPSLGSTAVADGPHALKVIAYDGGGHSTARVVDFFVDGTPPAVKLTAPLAPATVSGPYRLKAEATDGQAIERVEFWAGPTVVGVARSAPYEVDWDTNAFDNAPFDVGAVAYDLAGNRATSGVVQLTVQNSTTAVFDSVLRVPACAATGASCFSATRLQSRSVIAPIAEPNEPNTLDGCKDGLAGAYGESESIESIKVATLDGKPLAPGKVAQVDVRYYAFSSELDRVDLFYAADAHAPAWTRFATILPATTGFQTGRAVMILPSGPLQAVRAAVRYAENPRACTTGDFDDHDDLVFAVVTPGVDTTSPAVAISSPSNGGTLHGVVDVRVTATDDSGVARVELRDELRSLGTLTVPPYAFSFDTSTETNGQHTLTALAYDTSGNATTSNPVVVTVDNAANAVYDAGLGAPYCAAVHAFCDPGTLLAGRDRLGPELHAPDTLQSSCQDGSWGTYGVEGSVESIVVRTFDGSPLTIGGPALVDVTVIASAAFGAERLELYEATDAYAPRWRHLATLSPSKAGRQVLTEAYRLPPGTLQALRARLRYGGVEEACGTYVDQMGIQHGAFDDHDDLAFAVSGGRDAAWDKTLKVPRCTGTGSSCDSRALLDGRATLGPEPNEPNTLRAKCADGAAGTYHVDRSIDAVRVFAADSTALATGKNAVVEVKVFASKKAGDALDVYHTQDAATGNPVWTLLATVQATGEGLQTLNATVTLGSGSVQAIRASLRDGTAAPAECTTGAYDDHDDLAFDVAPGTPDTTKPSVAVVSPAPGTVLGGPATLAAVATDGSGVVSRVDFLVDGAVVGTAWQPKTGTLDRYEYFWTGVTVTDGSHTVVARATDGAGNSADSSQVSFQVSDVTAPTVALTLPAAGVALTGKVAVEASATDNRGVAAVAFYACASSAPGSCPAIASGQGFGGWVAATGRRLIGTARGSPWKIDWDTSAWSGFVVLDARAVDSAGNSTMATPTVVYVDHSPPQVIITSPTGTGQLAPIQLVTADVRDDDRISKVEFLLDGTKFATATAPPCAAKLDTSTFAEGAHVLEVVAYDRAGNSSVARMTVRVDRTAPTVRLLAPLAPATISGSYRLEAAASDGQMVDRVEFWAGSALVGVAYGTPYRVEWDTTIFDNGYRDVSAIAFDSAGNQAASLPVQMNVQNSTTAVRDATLHVPLCSRTGPLCFSASLLRSRAAIALLAEANQPNTLDGCKDGTGSGTYAKSESIEWIKVAMADGSPLTAGKLATIDVRYFAPLETDRVDLYQTSDARAPAWTFVATLTPTGTGFLSGSAEFKLTSGSLQAVRAVIRDGGLPDSCTKGIVDDHDDLAFAVAKPGVDTTSPTVSITWPANGATASGVVAVQVTAKDDTGVAKVEVFEGSRSLGALSAAPYGFAFDTTAVANGQHTLTAVAWDKAGNKKESNPVVLVVENAPALATSQSALSFYDTVTRWVRP